MPVTNFIWDPLNDSYLMETDGAGTTTAVYTQEPVYYGALVSQLRDTTPGFMHYDRLGSTRLVSNDTQSVVCSYTSDAWGRPVTISGVSSTSFRWIGRFGYFLDTEFDNLYVRLRTYSVATARWTAIDPHLTLRLLQPYIYSNNSPARLLDPSGLKCKSIAGYDPGVSGSGAGYVSGRGEFTEVLLRTLKPSDDPMPAKVSIGSYFEAKWKPKATLKANQFFDPPDGSTGCCCCLKIGFVQIVSLKSERYYGPGNTHYHNGFDHLWNFYNNFSWKIDSGVPYPHGNTTSHPCQTFPGSVMPRDGGNIDMHDLPHPEDAHGSWWLSPIQYYKHNFETCVVCLAGLESSLGSEGTRGRAIYGCVSWSQYFVRSGSTYSATRTLSGASGTSSAIVGDNSVFVQLKLSNDVGLPPSDEFIRVVGEQPNA